MQVISSAVSSRLELPQSQKKDPPTCLPLYKCVNLRKGKEPICKLSGFMYPPNISC